MILALLLSIIAQAAPPGDFLADLELFRSRSLVLRTDKELHGAAKSATLSRFLQFTPKLSAGVGKTRDKLEAINPLGN